MRTIAVVVGCSVVSWAHAGILSEVPKSQQAQLAAGEIVVQSRDVPGAPWPELKLYKVVDAPPSVVTDLFMDYDAAPKYTPNLLSAKVLTTNPDGSKDVEYTVKMPVVQKVSYTVRNSYKKTGDGYEVDWTLLKSPLAKSSDGSLRTEPYGDNQTLLCYTNLCVPITNLVSGLKNQALTEARATVTAIANEAARRAVRMTARQ
jgi:hypothetical protein